MDLNAQVSNWFVNARKRVWKPMILAEDSGSTRPDSEATPTSCPGRPPSHWSPVSERDRQDLWKPIRLPEDGGSEASPAASSERAKAMRALADWSPGRGCA